MTRRCRRSRLGEVLPNDKRIPIRWRLAFAFIGTQTVDMVALASSLYPGDAAVANPRTAKCRVRSHIGELIEIGVLTKLSCGQYSLDKEKLAELSGYKVPPVSPFVTLTMSRRVTTHAKMAPQGYGQEDFAHDLWVKLITARVGPRASALPTAEQQFTYVNSAVYRHSLNLIRSFNRRAAREDPHDPRDPILGHVVDQEVLADLVHQPPAPKPKAPPVQCKRRPSAVIVKLPTKYRTFPLGVKSPARQSVEAIKAERQSIAQ